MQSLAPFAAPSGRPQVTAHSTLNTTPLIPQIRNPEPSCPPPIPNVDNRSDYDSHVTTRQRVLFVCIHNSARSQMAEGFLRAWAGDRFEVHSAGIEARGVRPEAIAVMRELGVDIGAHESKTINRFTGRRWDHLITVCDESVEACPNVPGARTTAHWQFSDPSAVVGDDETRLAAFRRVRDDIAASVRDFIGSAG
jgi:arsenate reductase (thioredoxin)